MTVSIFEVQAAEAKVGVAGEGGPARHVAAAVGFPTSPEGLRLAETGFAPLDGRQKADHVEVVPLYSVAGEALTLHAEAAEVFLRCVLEDILPTSAGGAVLALPHLATEAAKSTFCELLFTTFDKVLPQNTLALSLFANGRVCGVALELNSAYAEAAAINDGAVLNAAAAFEAGAAAVTRPALDLVTPHFPYDAAKNPFVTASFLDFARRTKVYDALRAADDVAVTPDDEVKLINEQGLDRGLLAEHVPRLTARVVQGLSNMDILSTVVLGGEAVGLLSDEESTAALIDMGGLPRLQLTGAGLVKGWRVLRLHDSWFGASIVGSLSSFEKAAVTKALWQECGASTVWARTGL